MTSRPSRIALISDSFTRSLIVAPVAYGVIVASLSICVLGQLVRRPCRSSPRRCGPGRPSRGSRPCRCGRCARAAAAPRRAPAGMFVAIITRMRYLGGGFGRMPSSRRTQPVEEAARLLQAGQLGEQRLQRAQPPPPPPMPPMTNAVAPPAPARPPRRTCSGRSRDQLARLGGQVAAGRCSRRRRRRAARCRAGARRRPRRASRGCRARRPRRRRRSRRRTAGRACAACGRAPLTFSTPTPKNMCMNAPGSTNTYGLPVSPATASAISVLPVPGGPHSRMPLGT